MSKKVLIISGSPRRHGNSELLCEQFQKGAEESGNQVKMLRLSELHIAYCSACYACKKTGHCVKQDDMEQVLSSMRTADVIVLATPVYFYSMCAQMKTMIDRTLGGAQKPGLEQKEFYLIATAGDGADHRGTAWVSGMSDRRKRTGRNLWSRGMAVRGHQGKSCYGRGV